MYKIFAVSDATGKTANRVLYAALAQFDRQEVEIVQYGDVRSVARIREIFDEAAREGGFIVHTLVSEELRIHMLDEGRKFNVTTIDLMGPLLIRLAAWFETQPKSQPGLFHIIDEEYDRRIEAIEFTVKHDDGQEPRNLGQADIVLVGISRTSKTPLSIYLAHRGWKVANVPLVQGIDPPEQLFEVDPKRIAGLVIDPQRLVEVRAARLKNLGQDPKAAYADYEEIEQELRFAKRFFRQHPWAVIDVSAKAVEETANEVLVRLGLK